MGKASQLPRSDSYTLDSIESFSDRSPGSGLAVLRPPYVLRERSV